MDFEKNIKEYYSAFVTETEQYSGEVPYSPEEELLNIKKCIYQKNAKKKYIQLTAGIAAAVVMAVGIATFLPGKTVKNDNLVVESDANNKSSENVVAKTEPKPQVEYTTAPKESTRVISTAPPHRIASADSVTDSIYTPVPRITVPPMERTKEAVYDAEAEKAESNPTYILDDKEYYAVLPTKEPAIIITENEYIPAGSAVSAGDTKVTDDGGVWSESEYWEYIGKNPLIYLAIPSDINKDESDGKFILKDENGQIINDQMRFSYSNDDRTRLLNITVSKIAFAQTEDSSTFINGIRVSVFDNHMIHTAVFEGTDIYILAEMYGFSEDELKRVVYSIAEGMAL